VTFDINSVRSQFPALHIEDAGKRRIYLDGPAGTQVPQCVIDAVSQCFVQANANLGGNFPTTVAAEALVEGAREALADLMGAHLPESVVLGPNMTGLTKLMTASIATQLSPGDHIVLSRMDHDANVSPWLDMARSAGLHVNWLELDPATFQLDLGPLEGYLKAGAKLVAAGYASNVLGTINDVREICDLARRYNAISYIDAVHYAPHGTIDVEALGCDMLVCSVYKFFGPHCAALYVRPEVLERLPAQPLRPAPQTGPVKFESGTMNHEGLAGSLAAVDYIASLSALPASANRRARIVSAFDAIQAHENALLWPLIEGIKSMGGYTIHGITDPNSANKRAPTLAITHARHSPQAIEQALTAANIFSWAGHSYAIEPLGALGLLKSGGILRLGIAHYNTQEEMAETLAVLAQLNAQ
jgi:cysteine desulfurase family protein (TIGR01976 family)